MTLPDDRATALEVLRALDFGKVDSESEPDLDQRFVRTEDFDKFSRGDIWLTLGAKGTGKSALFELFAKYENVARRLIPGGLPSVRFTTGTGFTDLTEVATGDIERLRGEAGYDHDKLWRLYIAVKAAAALADSHHVPHGPLKDLLVALGSARDYRVGPLLKELWQTTVGDGPREITVSARGATVTLRGGRRNIDVVALLTDVQAALDAEGKSLWILFDKIDEIFPSDRNERVRAIEGLMTATMSIRRTFPAVQPKIMLRTDIWRDLDFTNKSHLADKQVELRWSKDQLSKLLLKRACVDGLVRRRVAAAVPEASQGAVEDLAPSLRKQALQMVFPETVYPGEREAEIMDWIDARVTDAQGTALPRESILLGNYARDEQLSTGRVGADSLIGREAVRDAFARVSRTRCETYLAEFPHLNEHFRRFEGETSATFPRTELARLMRGLEPAGDDLIRELHEVGLLQPLRGNVSTAESFEIPRLYRIGLGLVIRGRP